MPRLSANLFFNFRCVCRGFHQLGIGHSLVGVERIGHSIRGAYTGETRFCEGLLQVHTSVCTRPESVGGCLLST
jgi:hypothetical protein